MSTQTQPLPSRFRGLHGFRGEPQNSPVCPLYLAHKIPADPGIYESAGSLHPVHVLRRRVLGTTTGPDQPPSIYFGTPMLARRLLVHVDNPPHPHTRRAPPAHLDHHPRQRPVRQMTYPISSAMPSDDFPRPTT